MKAFDQVNDQLIRALKRDQQIFTNFQSSDRQSLWDDGSNDIYIKSIKNTRYWTIRELEDHLIELQHKKLNTSGVVSKLLTKYCTECLTNERIMPKPVRVSYMKRISELEAIYFDKNKTTGFPSLGVVAILIDYCKLKEFLFEKQKQLIFFSKDSRVVFNLDKVIQYIGLKNDMDPNFKLDPHKCVSVISLLIRKHSFDQAIEFIDSVGCFDVIPNYMYRRVRDLLFDVYSLLKFEQFEYLANKLLRNSYIEPSSIILSLIVRKSYQDHGPLQAFETIKKIFVQWNNLVATFPVIRKLLRDDCTEELKQVEIDLAKYFNHIQKVDRLSVQAN